MIRFEDLKDYLVDYLAHKYVTQEMDHAPIFTEKEVEFLRNTIVKASDELPSYDTQEIPKLIEDTVWKNFSYQNPLAQDAIKRAKELIGA